MASMPKPNSDALKLVRMLDKNVVLLHHALWARRLIGDSLVRWFRWIRD